MSVTALAKNKRRSKIFVLLLVAAVLGVAAVPAFLAGSSGRRPPVVAVPATLALPAGVNLAQLQAATVYEVVDGDTLDVRIGREIATVRYYGVDTPEAGERCFREATDRNTMLARKTVYLLRDARDQDSFGRLLRYVFLQNGQSVDATLVAEGFGHAWTQDGLYRDQIVALEGEAQAAGRGCLWK